MSDLRMLRGRLQKSLSAMPGFQGVGIYLAEDPPGLVINFDEETVHSNAISVKDIRHDVEQAIRHDKGFEKVSYKIQLLGKLRFGKASFS